MSSRKKKKKNTASNKANPPVKSRAQFSIAPWIVATIIIFLIVIAAHKEYISSIVSQILLVLTVVLFSVYQRYGRTSK